MRDLYDARTNCPPDLVPWGKVEMRPLTQGYILVNRQGSQTPSSGSEYSDSESINSQTPKNSESPTSSLSFETRSSSKSTFPENLETTKKDGYPRNISPEAESCVFKLLDQIEDQIVDCQADFAKLKQACEVVANPIPKTAPVLESKGDFSPSSTPDNSKILSIVETEIKELERYRDILTGRYYSQSPKDNVDEDSTTQPITQQQDACQQTRRIIFRQGVQNKDYITIAEICEVMAGILGFLYIIFPMLYCLSKLFIFIFILLSPFHSFS